MTINVTALAPDFIIQASDRQISSGGRPLAEWNKAVTFVSPQLRLAVTYTGIAMGRDGRPTDMWIGERLAKARFGEANVEEIAEALALDATSRFRSFPRKERVTILTLAGWDRSAGDQPVVFQVENCLDLSGRLQDVRPSFAYRALGTSRRVHVAGATDAVHRVDRKLIDRLIRCNRSKQKVLESIVQLIRRAASRSEGSVSEDCMTILLERGDRSPEATFHQADAVPVSYGPTVAVCNPSGATFALGQPIVVYGSPAMEAEYGGFAVGDPDKGLGVRVAKDPNAGKRQRQQARGEVR